jgi:glutamate-5-semialdehyde dehydrogenase
MPASTTIADLDTMLAGARRAARAVAALSPDERRSCLLAMADSIAHHRADILQANRRDLEAARTANLPDALIERLTLNDARIDAMVAGVRTVADLPDTLYTNQSALKHANGMLIRKVTVPLGVIAIIFESRPNVTVDAACLCFKAGNAVVLKGGSEALHSNTALLRAMCNKGDNAEPAGLPEHAVQLIATRDRAVVIELLHRDDMIDLVIPRGGESLIRAVAEHATMPVMKHYKGVCHVYVDADADVDMALRIIENGKCQRPGVCNATETVLVHADIAMTVVPELHRRLSALGVELRGCDATRQHMWTASRAPAREHDHPLSNQPSAEILAASDDDWREEYLALILAIRIVPSLEAAIEHIETFGSRHSDVIVTENPANADRFVRDVDSAAVYVNVSSRFTDGGEFGLGAEIGISTDKLHARGPCGVASLTTYKYIIEGDGQIRT